MNSFKRKLLLLQGLLNGCTARIGPEIVDLDVTNRCNLRCVGCIYHSQDILKDRNFKFRQRDFPLALFYQMLEQLETVRAHTLVFQGSGEPLLHPHIVKMLHEARAKGFATHLLTNGTLLDPKTAGEILESGLDGIRVSLWASNQDEYSRNYPGTPSHFLPRVLANLQSLNAIKKKHKRSTRVLLYCVINAHNMESMDEFVRIAKNTGCDGIHFGLFYTSFSSSKALVLSEKKRREIATSMKALKAGLKRNALQENAAWFLDRLSRHDTDWMRYPCYEPWFHARISPNGDVEGCTRCIPPRIYGNLYDADFATIWNGPTMQKVRRDHTKPRAVEQLMKCCDCTSCCFGWQIKRIHKFYRWFLPLTT